MGSVDPFRARLNQINNMTHEQLRLAAKIDWQWIDGEIAPLYRNKDRPRIASRFVGRHAETYHQALYVAMREQEGREARPTTAIISSPRPRQKLKKGGAFLAPSGGGAAKNIECRKQHILVDALRLLLNVVARPANVHDRNGAFKLLRRVKRCFRLSSAFCGRRIHRKENGARGLAQRGMENCRS